MVLIFGTRQSCGGKRDAVALPVHQPYYFGVGWSRGRLGSTAMKWVRPDSTDYDETRKLFNAMIDRRPAVIAQCADAADVADALAYARDNSLDVAVRAGGHWGEFDRATQEHGLATTGGRASSTGVAGFTLGGGSGWLERSFGFACDNLLSVDLVTAAGERVTASAQENPGLFWALHGGGGNFGVATSFTFQLHELG